MKQALKISLIIVLLLTLTIFTLRLTTPREIDDLSPKIYCEENYLEKSKIIWVIPNYQDFKISENKTWCKEIISLNKTIGMHGINHTYHELEVNNLTQEDLDIAINIFEECFNKTPTLFKAPNLALSKENKKLLKENNLKVRNPFHQTIHKVYHCNDTGILSNKFHDLF